ncbi:hypothetical protein V8E55_004778 [Tylopilus felleus]
MEKISDTITSVFHIAMKDYGPVICPSDGATVWSETFGLGWRFGISYNSRMWFPKVHLYLDHNHTQTQQDQATVTVYLGDTADKDAKGLKERVTTISDFGHGEPTLLGSWSSSVLALYPYVSVTLTTNTRLPDPATYPLPPTSLAMCQSLEDGEFIDTKFYVFSAKRPGFLASKPRAVYANSTSIGVVLPKPTLGTKRTNGLAPAFLVNMTSDHLINDDSVLHEYEYQQDSDLDEEDDDSDDTAPRRSPLLGKSQMARSASKPQTPTSPRGGANYEGTEDEFPEPPAYSVSNCRMILVKGVAYKTWLSYVYFRYSGQVSFRPLKSAPGSPPRPPNDTIRPPSCSPKSMYRLAATLGDERMKELARRAIHQGLSEDNIVEEAFSWFTAQYEIISEYEVEKVFELRKSPKVSSALRLQLKVVSHGEKPWAQNVLIAIMDKLNATEP